ncbi:uncharacterized protein TNCV_2031771 [Trichonephila clavipes]|nr:uncharacterized protein TNCV_2031771 [Trichonephila clavipes]
MRAIGKGGAAARIFCALMNLPPPPAKFERHNSLFLNVLKTISEDFMNAAVHEAVIANDNNSNIAVAVDGTWHKRGYSSLNGVVCATSVENRKWGMECRGVLSIFQRSETSRKACYTQYLGDGDSKGFLTIKEAKVYGDTEVEKLECVGHVQKRMGTRLRNILKMSKGIKLSDGKNISGRGRLTLKEVDSIQHYYGLAIRKNLSSVEDMKRAIWAIYFHELSTEDNPQHALCPLGEDSWVDGKFSVHQQHGLILPVTRTPVGSIPRLIAFAVVVRTLVGSINATFCVRCHNDTPQRSSAARTYPTSNRNSSRIYLCDLLRLMLSQGLSLDLPSPLSAFNAIMIRLSERANSSAPGFLGDEVRNKKRSTPNFEIEALPQICRHLSKNVTGPPAPGASHVPAISSLSLS